MEKKHYLNFLQFISLCTVFLIPTYLIRFSIFNMPTNLLEVLAFTTIVLWLFSLNLIEFIATIWKTNKKIIVSQLAILLGLFISLAFNFQISGLGIIKGWFFVPMIFGLVIYQINNQVKDFWDKLLIAIFASTSIVAIASLGYRFFELITYDGRLRAFYESPNYLAFYLSIGTIVGAFLFSKNSFSPRAKGKILALLCILLLALLYTYSYASWLALFATFCWYILIHKKRIAFLLLITLLLLVFFALSPKDKLSNFFNPTPRSSISSRLMIWNSSVLMIKNHPLVGIGPGNFQNTYLNYQKYFPPYLEWAVPQPHNLFLAFYLEAGLLGLLAFCLYVFLAIKKFNTKKEPSPVAVLSMLIVVFILILGLFETPLFKNDLAFIFWILLSGYVFKD